MADEDGARSSPAAVRLIGDLATGRVRWMMPLGVVLFAYLAVRAAQHGLWGWFAVELAFAASGIAVMTLKAVFVRKEEIFLDDVQRRRTVDPPRIRPGQALIRIHRPPSLYGAARHVAFNVVIDGIDVGAIERGETKDFPVKPGDHRVTVEDRRRTSGEWGVRLAEGEVGELVCVVGETNDVELTPVDDE